MGPTSQKYYYFTLAFRTNLLQDQVSVSIFRVLLALGFILAAGHLISLVVLLNLSWI